jgi:hypothetical protein
MTESLPPPSDAAGVVAELLGPGKPLTDETYGQAGHLVILRTKGHRKGYHSDAIRGGLIVKALRDRQSPMSWFDIRVLTGIPERTASRWLASAETYLSDPTFTNQPVEEWTT